MKRLVIIVPKDSAINFYLAHAGFIYDKIVHLSDIVCYNMAISKSLQLIDLLVSEFCLYDFTIRCHDGVATFRVRS